MKKIQEDKFIVSVRVGPKGQITVPAVARKMFDIKEGEINRNLFINFFTECVEIHKKCIFAAQSTTKKYYGLQN